MPKISALPPMTTADAADEAPIVDTSVTTTKKWTLTLLKTYLQSLTNFITDAMVTEGSIALKRLSATVAFYGYKASGTQATTNGSAKVTLNGEVFDQGSNFDSATNSRFVAPVNGIYQFSGGIRFANGASARCIALLYKNGALYSAGTSTGADTFAGSSVSATIKLAATDYIELYHTSNTAANNFDITAPAQSLNFLSGSLIGEY